MELINIQHPEDRTSFRAAVLQGLGRGQGLFFPRRFKALADVPDLLREPFVPRSVVLVSWPVANAVWKGQKSGPRISGPSSTV